MEMMTDELKDKFNKLGCEYIAPASGHTGYWFLKINESNISYYPNNDSRLFINGKVFGRITKHKNAFKIFKILSKSTSVKNLFIYN